MFDWTRARWLSVFYASAVSKVWTCCYNYSPWKGAFKGALHSWCSIPDTRMVDGYDLMMHARYPIPEWSMATIWWCICLCYWNKSGVMSLSTDTNKHHCINS